MDCETNDCRKEKMGCKGCFYDKNFDNSYDYILKLNTREELIENGLKLLDELEEYQSINNCQKQSIDTLNFNIRNLQKELANKDKELETYKKIAEKLAEELSKHIWLNDKDAILKIYREKVEEDETYS